MHETQGELRPEHGLPRYSTEIIGRAHAIDEIADLLTHSRLVTIVGTGGIGKTRIATQVARAGDTDSVAFANLEPLRDPQLVISTVAAAVGCELQGTSDPEMALVNVLAEQSLLLVLDNCEHVLRRASSLCHLLLASCPHIRILATSREALGIESESIYRLKALDDEASVQLFIKRAADAGTTITTPDDLATVSEICRRLDGIPLAIELAAARIEDRTPKALLARLRERFRLLEQHTSETITAHHRTLRAMIDWSYDLLSVDERNIFVQLSVFCGDFSREGAKAVVAPDVNLDHFARKSLIVPSPEAAGRFQMFESIREYAMLHLTPEEAENVQRAHAAYYADLAAKAASEYGVASEEFWIARYVPDLDNFRAALTWMYGNDRTRAAETLGNLKEFWFHNNLSYEGLNRSQALVASLRLDDDRALGPLLAISSLAWRAGEFRVSYDAAKRALEIGERHNDARAIAQARFGLGWALFKLGDMENALDALSVAVKEYRELNEPLRTLLAEIDYAIALKRSDPRAGRALLERTLESARTSGWPRAAMRVETGLAEYAFLDDDTNRAIALGNEAIATARQGSSIYALSVALLNTSAYLSIAGRHDEALAMAYEASGLSRSHGFRIITEWSLQSVAIGIAERGDARTAALILGHVDAFVDETGAKREPTEMAVRNRLFELITKELEGEAIGEVIRRGRTLSMVDACSLAFPQ